MSVLVLGALVLLAVAAPAAAADTIEIDARLTDEAAGFVGDAVGTWDLFCVIGGSEPCQEDVAGTVIEENSFPMTFPAEGGEGGGTFTFRATDTRPAGDGVSACTVGIAMTGTLVAVYDAATGTVTGTMRRQIQYELISGCDGALSLTDSDSEGPFSGRVDGDTFVDTTSSEFGPVLSGTVTRTVDPEAPVVATEPDEADAPVAEDESVGEDESGGEDGLSDLAAALIGAGIGGAIAAAILRFARGTPGASAPAPQRMFSDDESLRMLEGSGLVEQVVLPDGSIAYAPRGDLAGLLESGQPPRVALGRGMIDAIAITEGPDGTIVSATIVVQGDPTPAAPDAPAPDVPQPDGPSLADQLGREFMIQALADGPIPEPPSAFDRMPYLPPPADPAPDPYVRTRPHFEQAADLLLQGMNPTTQQRIEMAQAIERGAKNFVHAPNFHFEDIGLSGEQQGVPNAVVDSLRRATAELLKGHDVPQDAQEEVVNSMLDEVARHLARDLQ